ncbi:alpha-tocopherol transfer protein-like isoform X1 [Haematobia irritans]|uniref:alpha-tocopherol transfer protein-like isoform X1 n=1 Tax=Haematobia irritans TaxID=7368 RepID=UPI003F506A47
MSADMEKKVDELQQWLKTQPQLPPKIGRGLLKRFLATNYGDLEAAKKLIQFNYKLRNKYDNIFLKRDPLSAETQEMLRVTDHLILPGRTPDNERLVLIRFEDCKPEKYNSTEAIKLCFLVMDCSMAIDSEINDGEILIFDLQGYTLKHLTRSSLGSLRVFLKFGQEAYVGRIKQIHVINAPSYMDRIMAVMKPFMKSEILKVIQFHSPGSDTPYEFFPRSLLPEEYGGNAGKLSDLRQYWIDKLKEKREELIDESRWKMNKGKTTSDIVDDLQKLEID